MKKTLLLAAVMALGVNAGVYAANPFSDVPAGHWAYDAVNKLAAEGVVEGYPDGTYGGDRLMTRYEMAQITAKAMAKGANADRLAAEFAGELDSLGVRAANLEKKSDNVRITGQIRYEYGDRGGDLGSKYGKTAQHRLRSRIFVNGSINEDWSYTGRFENNQSLKNSSGDDTLKFNQAYVNGKIGGAKLLAGKTDHYAGNGFIYDDTAEKIELSYGKDVKLTAYYGIPTDYGYDKMWGASVGGKVGNLSLSAGYDKFQDALNEIQGYEVRNSAKTGTDNGIWNLSANYKFGDFTLAATYLDSDIDLRENSLYKDVDTNGYVVGLNYKGADKNKPGTWGLFANYYDQGAGTFVAHTMYPGDWSYYVDEGFKGYMVGGGVTLAKNMVYQLHYYDLEGKESGLDDQVLWSRLQIMF